MTLLLLGLLFLSHMCKSVNFDPNLATIQKFLWRVNPLSSASGDSIRNFWRAAQGGSEDFESACLKVWARRSAALLVAQWLGRVVWCTFEVGNASLMIPDLEFHRGE